VKAILYLRTQIKISPVFFSTSWSDLGKIWYRRSPHIFSVAGRSVMFSVITHIYSKKTKGHTLMELFTATGKLKKIFLLLTTTDVRCVHHRWHGTQRYDIQILATNTSTWVNRYSSLLQWSVPLGQRGHVAMLWRILCTKCTLHSNHRLTVWYSNTKKDFSPEAAIFSLHALASPRGRYVNYDEKQHTEKKIFELFFLSLQVS